MTEGKEKRMKKKGFTKKMRQMLALTLVMAMVVALLPSDAKVLADEISVTEDATEETSEENAPDANINEESAEAPVLQETSEATSNDAGAEEVEEETEKVPTEVVPTFDTSYDGVSVEGLDFSSCELLIATEDAGIFTQDTEVVAEYDGVYLTRYADAEQTKNAYTYYYSKADIVEVNTVITADTEEDNNEAQSSEDEEASDDGEDDQQTQDAETIPNEGHGEADLSNINNGDDAFSNASELTVSSYKGYIALIDTGAAVKDNVKKAVSLIGDSASDDNGHGEKMVKTIASANKDAKILAIKALDNRAAGQVSDIYAAIKYATEAEVSVINLSMSSIKTAESSLLEEAILDATNKGIVVVCSAGNNGKNAKYYMPANIKYATTIGACDKDGNKLDSSNYGDDVNFYVVADSTSEAAAKFSAYVLEGITKIDEREDVFTKVNTSDDKDNKEDKEEVKEDNIDKEAEVTADAIGDSWQVQNGTTWETYKSLTSDDTKYIAVGTSTSGGITWWRMLWNTGSRVTWSSRAYCLDAGLNEPTRSELISLNCTAIPDTASETVRAFFWTNAGLYKYGADNPENTINGSCQGYDMGASVSESNTIGVLRYAYADNENPAGVTQQHKDIYHDIVNNTTFPVSTPHYVLWGNHRDLTVDSVGFDWYNPANFLDVYVLKIGMENATGGSFSTGSDWALQTSGTITGTSVSANGYYKKTGITYSQQDGRAVFCGTNLKVPAKTYYEVVGQKTFGPGENFVLYAGDTLNIYSQNYGALVSQTSDSRVYNYHTETINFGSGYQRAGYLTALTPGTATLAYNVPEKHSYVSIKKVDASNNHNLDGCDFTVYAQKGTDRVDIIGGTGTSRASDGMVIFTGNNKYYLEVTDLADQGYTIYAKETKAKAGYKLNDKVVTLTPKISQNPDADMLNAPSITAYNDKAEATLIKTSSNPSCTDGNENYSLQGTTFGVYKDANYTQFVGNLTIDANGNSNTLNLSDSMNPDPTTGRMIATTFYYKETAWGKGYIHNNVTGSITVQPNSTGRIREQNAPAMDPVTIVLKKQGADGNQPTGAASLAGAQFTLSFYDKDITSAFSSSWTPKRQWVLETKQIGTDGNGNAVYGIDCNDISLYKVSGPDFYYNDNNEVSFPQGFLKIEETKAPAGYTLSGDFEAYDKNGDAITTTGTNNAIVLKTTDNGTVTTNNVLVQDDSFVKNETPIRADIQLDKVDEDENAMEGVIWKVERTDTTPHQTVFLMTDENGHLSTHSSYVSHKVDTNIGTSADKAKAKTGTWFGDTNHIDDALGALPYGDYTITEIRSSANVGKQLEEPRYISKTEIENNNGGVITIVDPDATDPENKNWNMVKPKIHTVAYVLETSEPGCAAEDGSKTLAQAGSNINYTDQTIADKIYYEKLRAGSHYVFLTELMVVDKDGNVTPYDRPGYTYRQVTPLTVSADYKKSIYEKTGDITVNIEHVDPTGLEEQQKKLVVYESVYLDERNEYTTVEKLDQAIASGTIATRYPVYSADDDMDFFPVEHKDKDDDFQTVTPGDIHTTAENSVSLDRIAKNDVQSTLVDHVYYTGLTPGEEYTLSGKLVVKEGKDWTNIKYDPADPNADAEGFVTTTTSTGSDTAYFLKDANGKLVTASKTFVPTERDGYVDIEFTFDASLLEGKSTVAFEELSYKDLTISIHTDLNDEDETVHYPLVHTTSRNDLADLSKAQDADDEKVAKQVDASDKSSFIDTIHYENLLANRTYIARGILMDKSTGKEMLDANGKKIIAEKEFKTNDVGEVKIEASPDAVDYVLADGTKMDLSADHANYLCDGDVDVKFEGYDFTNLGNKVGVVFEEVYLINEDTKEEKLVGDHKDISDVDQFIYYVKIRTKAKDVTTDTKVVPYNKDTFIEDTITYNNVIPGKEYTMTAYLVVKNDMSGKYKDGDKLLDKEGKPITVTHTFTPTKPDGEEVVKIPVNTAPYKDMEIVVFEGMENKFGIEIATHMDLTDEDQTIEVPGGGTKAKDKATDDEIARNIKELEIVDTITYRNLEPGKEYTATGVLYKKSTKEPLKDANGNVIKNTVTFTPAAKNGTVDVTFKVDASLLGGETIVVFEDVLYKNETVFIHHDIEDSNQSTYIPKIGTTATAKNGDKSVSASKNVTIVDKVQYTNLVPGKEYKVSGILYDKSTGGKLVINGQNVTAEKTFTPEKADGYVEIEFTFDASSLSTSVVAFEYLYHKDVEVTTHTDITDEGQTVSITPPSKPGVPTPPKTGMMIFFIILGIMVAGGAGMLIFRKKKA